MKTGKWPPWWQFEWLFQRRYRATYATVITSWCLWNVSTSIWNHDFVSSTSSRRHRRHSWRTVRLKSASNANHCGTVFVEYRFCAKFISTCYDVKLYLFLVGPLRKKRKWIHSDALVLSLSYRFDHLLLTLSAPVVGIFYERFLWKSTGTYRPKRTKKGVTGLALDQTWQQNWIGGTVYCNQAVDDDDD